MLATTLLLLVVLLALSVPVAAVMGVLGLALNQFYASMPLHRAMGEIVWNASSEYILIAIPLFVMLGEILLRSGIAERVYNGIAQWLSWLPGGLMHANIGACAMFAATSGSSVATAATIGTVAIPEIKKHNYDEPLFLGTIAAGGTLGILIPPSINFILYGLLTNTSVPRLYLAGFIPGFLLASFFMVIVLIVLPVRSQEGRHADRDELEQAASRAAGADPAAVHLPGRGRLDLCRHRDADGGGLARRDRRADPRGVGAARVAVDAARRGRGHHAHHRHDHADHHGGAVPQFRAGGDRPDRRASARRSRAWVSASIGTMLLIVVFYLILGCFMETISMMILTTPFIAPIVFALGWDPIWWGIVLTILIEAALITPPVGLNLYVVQGMRGRGSINEVIRGALPFVFAMVALIGLLMAFPDIALWLPRYVMGGS